MAWFRQRSFSAHLPASMRPILPRAAARATPPSEQTVPAVLRSRILLLVPLGVAAVLGFRSLGAKSLWFDEAFSVELARQDWPSMWRVIRVSEANMALYHGFLHGWVTLGVDEFTVRTPSVLAALAALGAVYALGERLLGRTVALVACLLLALNAFFIQYAQEARGYSLLLLLATLSALLYVRAMNRPSVGAWAAYVVVTSLGAYTHVFTVWVVASEVLEATIARRRVVPERRFLLSLVALAILVSPLAVWALHTDRSLSYWLTRPTGRELLGFFGTLAGNGGLGRGLLFLASCVVGVLAVRVDASQPPPREAVHPRRFLLIWLLFPPLATFVVSELVTPMFHPRYLIVCLPPLVLLAAAGATALRPAALRTVGVLLLLGASARGLHHWLGTSVKDDWRSATEYVVARAEPADGIVFRRLSNRIPFEHYLRGRGGRLEPILPSAAWGAMDWVGPERRETFAQWLQGHSLRQRRVWLVEWPPPKPARGGARDWVPGAFRARYCTSEERTFTRTIRVRLYVRCGGAEPADEPAAGRQVAGVGSPAETR